MSFYVYLYTCPVRNEPIYVGKGTGPRWSKHLVRKDKHPLTQRLQWMRKSGFEPQISFICEDVSEEFAMLCEMEAISKYGRKDLGLGPLLNLTDGGEGVSGVKHSREVIDRRAASIRKALQTPEVRAKISASNKGKVRSEETKAKIAESLRGVKHTEERRKNISAANTGKKLSEEAKQKLRDHVVSDETRQKLKEKQLGRKYGPETRQRMSEAAKLRWAQLKAAANVA